MARLDRTVNSARKALWKTGREKKFGREIVSLTQISLRII